jgi:hypothetical protein
LKQAASLSIFPFHFAGTDFFLPKTQHPTTKTNMKFTLPEHWNILYSIIGCSMLQSSFAIPVKKPLFEF